MERKGSDRDKRLTAEEFGAAVGALYMRFAKELMAGAERSYAPVNATGRKIANVLAMKRDLSHRRRPAAEHATDRRGDVIDLMDALKRSIARRTDGARRDR